MEYVIARLRLIAARIGLITAPSLTSTLSGVDKTIANLRKAQDAANTRERLANVRADQLRAQVRDQIVAGSNAYAEATKAGRVAVRLEELVR